MTARSRSEGPWYAHDMTAPADPHPDPWFPEVPKPPLGEWWSDEPAMETYRHMMQQLALIMTLRWYWRDRTDYFVGGNLTVYFSPTHQKSIDFRGPDFFVVQGVDGTRDRKSWVVWEEGGRYPDVIVELLSDTTKSKDRGEKKQIYAQVFRTPEYFLFDPYSFAFEGFRLEGGEYERITPDAQGRLACDQLGILFGVQDGELRMFERAGALITKPEEQVEAALDRVEQETRRAEQEHQRADAAAQEVERERRRAEDAEAELEKLREELRKIRDGYDSSK